MPTVVITPPKHPKRSSSIVSAPARRAAIAADSPAGPEPTTRTCNMSQDCSVRLRRLCVCVCVCVCVCARARDEQRLHQTALQGQSQPQEPALRSRQKARLLSEPAKIDKEPVCSVCAKSSELSCVATSNTNTRLTLESMARAASSPVWPQATPIHD
jgi:hypothetical protein